MASLAYWGNLRCSTSVSSIEGAMPHALLLSPDDQAVSAISGVLEEMSVSCERPLDGVSAAQKLNARSFDLVLVDCENLPAAKLIFDVCRRGKNGINPVPIAVVDGRAGLPTAFRLGAELILTKPVAKDQARSTIRTAVTRLRKEEPVRTAQTPDAAPIAAAVPTPPEEWVQTAVAAVSAQPVQLPDAPPTAVDATPVPAKRMSTAVKEIAAAPASLSPEAVSPEKPSTPKELLVASKPTPHEMLSDDPVLADLERGDVAPSPTAAFSSCEAAPPKSRSHMAAVLILALVVGGIDAAWIYQPGFRAMVQPLVNRTLALAGVAPQQKAVAAQPVPAWIPVQPAPASSATPSTTSSTDAARSKGMSTTANSPDAGPRDPAPAMAKPESLVNSKKTEAASASSDNALLDDRGTVILSSKGAEKRLVRQIPPTYPQGVTAQGLEGTVILKTVVDDSGKVESVHLIEGNPALADAAIHAVEQWRYRPYVRGGKSLPFQTVVLVDFQRP
jgi:TonB family protein